MVTIIYLITGDFNVARFLNLKLFSRDNWTRLAAQEITRFQEELIKSMSEEIALQQPLQVVKYGGKHAADNYEWSFAKAFLYSLTVLTTVGKSHILLLGYVDYMIYNKQCEGRGGNLFNR